MGKFLRWTGYVAGAVLLLVVGLWSVSRLRGATAEQEAALAVMQQPWQPQGRNAFAALWLLPYDVPEAAQAAILAEDARRLRARPVAGIETSGDEPVPAFESVAADRYRDLTPDAHDQAMLCGARDAGCLAKVRVDQTAYAALVERNAVLFARVGDLSRYDYYGNGFAWRFDAPIPEFTLGKALLTVHALEFARGDVDAALAGTCRDIATWRRLGANSDSLIMRMIGIAYSTDGYGRLLADMLVQLPREQALPQACTAALAPMKPAEISLCRPMQGEFLYASGAMTGMVDHAAGGRFDRLLLPLLYSDHMTRAEKATVFAPACSDAALRRIADDRAPERVPPGKPYYLRLGCMSNAVGCILNDIAAPAYGDYALRAQDQGARMQLLATLAWLRGQPQDGKPLVARLAERPPDLKSPARDIEITDDGTGIRIRQFDAKRGEYWRLPLPPYLWAKAPD